MTELIRDREARVIPAVGIVQADASTHHVAQVSAFLSSNTDAGNGDIVIMEMKAILSI